MKLITFISIKIKYVVNIGIGGSPAANAKVTVYGVVNTLSDMREKSNISFQRPEPGI